MAGFTSTVQHKGVGGGEGKDCCLRILQNTKHKPIAYLQHSPSYPQHACTHTHIHTHTHTHKDTHYKLTRAHIHTHTHYTHTDTIDTRAHINTFIHTPAHIYTHTYIHVYTYTCIHTSANVHTHTRTHVYTLTAKYSQHWAILFCKSYPLFKYYVYSFFSKPLALTVSLLLPLSLFIFSGCPLSLSLSPSNPPSVI